MANKNKDKTINNERYYTGNKSLSNTNPTTITWHVPYNYYLSNKHIWFIRVESFDLFIGLHAISIPDYLDFASNATLCSWVSDFC
jgi:hypothetical protein